MRTFLLCSAVALVAALGCNKKQERPAGGAAGSAGSAGVAAGSGSAPAPAAPAGTVEIFVNDTSVAKVAPDQIATWPRVDTLVPEESRRLGTWVKVKLPGARPEEVARPSQNHPDMVPALFPGEDGKPSFGMFDAVEHAKKGKPGLRADGVGQIRIEVSTEGRMGDHQGGASEGADPTKLVVAIEGPQGAGKLTGEQLLAIPREASPDPESKDRGWRLAQLLDAAGIKKYEQLVLLDASGTSVIVERKDLEGKKAVPFIKLNKQGQLRLRVLEQAGTGWKTGGELRALATIRVAK